MKNWKDNHKQTGIGNHLRTQYCKLLLQYERVHQDDLNVDACQICKMVHGAGTPLGCPRVTAERWQYA